MSKTYVEAMNWFATYRGLKSKKELFENKMGGLKAISYSNEAKGTPRGDSMSYYMDKIDKVTAEMDKIESYILEHFEFPVDVYLYKKYIQCISVKEIESDIGYSSRYLLSLTRKAFKRLK